MDMLISPHVIILFSLLLILFVLAQARRNAVRRIKLLENKGLVNVSWPVSIEYSPYISDSDRQTLFRDVRILMMSMQPWETQCVNR